MQSQQKPDYFPILDAFRFFAFFRVFLLHIPGVEVNPFFSKITEGGETGVDFFFVLSGFLISYLFIKEQNSTGTIDGKKYFLRRALRIWPLYFLAIVIAFAGVYVSNATATDSGDGYKPNLLTLLTFTENYRMIFTDSFPDGAPLRVLWSVCVEEHFYILWLLLFTFIKPKYIPKAIIILWIIGFLYRIVFYILYPDKTVYDPDLFSKMDYFCSGGLAAHFFSNRSEQAALVINKIPGYIRNGFTLLMIAAFFFFQFFIDVSREGAIVFPIISAALFGMLIFVTVSSGSFINKNYKGIFSKLGKISYGLYVYHTVVITILTKLALRYQFAFTENKFVYAAFCITCLAVSVLISIGSYQYFEKYFLKKKPRPIVSAGVK
jgi:peptidoglycan/LPS O-acetylase OafA/YrhL